MTQGEIPAPRRKIKIEVPDLVRLVSDDIWQDLETYLFAGFLYSSANIFDKTFVFKTLNAHEVRSIMLQKPVTESDSEARALFNTSFIAYSIFMYEGENLLVDRHRHLRRLTKTMMKLNEKIIQKILVNLNAINQRATRLYPLTEIYVHENRSRFKWFQIRDIPIHSSMNTGILGTETLGANYCQSNWVALNHLTDRKEEMERDWSNAKFIGSCMNSKGVRAIDEKDRARRDKEQSEIDDLRQKVLYRYVNKLPDEEEAPATIKLPDGREAVVEKRFKAESVTELAEQLSSALSGEKDHHDAVIEARENKIRHQRDVIEEYKRSLYDQSNLKPIEGTPTRILGGKKEIDDYIARLEDMRLNGLARAMKKIEPSIEDINDPDKDEGH